LKSELVPSTPAAEDPIGFPEQTWVTACVKQYAARSVVEPTVSCSCDHRGRCERVLREWLFVVSAEHVRTANDLNRVDDDDAAHDNHA
jgi:hypothetical protein